MELKERERYVFVIICTFSGEMGYRDLEEKEREEEHLWREEERFQFILGVFEGK